MVKYIVLTKKEEGNKWGKTFFLKFITIKHILLVYTNMFNLRAERLKEIQISGFEMSMCVLNV